MKKWRFILSATSFASMIFANAYCSVPRVTVHALGSKPPLCRNQMHTGTLVLWGTAWRENQKEPGLRRAIASQAITQFFHSSSCFSNVQVLELAGGHPSLQLSDTEALKFAASLQGSFQKIIFVRIEELGPLIIIYPSPILWEGGTEVALRIRVLNAQTSALETDISIHWKNTGAFILRGTRGLAQDLMSALASVFLHK
jgi:hypothetical protein